MLWLYWLTIIGFSYRVLMMYHLYFQYRPVLVHVCMQTHWYYSWVSCFSPSSLASTGDAANPAVSSMGTWELIPTVTLHAYTFICEECCSLLQASPVPGSTLVLHRYPSADSLGRYDRFAAAEGFVLLCVRVCMCVCVRACVCVYKLGKQMPNCSCLA